MKKILPLFVLSTLLASPQAFSKDEKNFFSIEEAFASEDYKEKLDQDIQFYFGDQPHPKVIESKGNFVSNKKTNAAFKADEAVCKWALLSALLSFQDRVKSEGGNAVINIESYYKKQPYRSDTEYECHNGAIMAGVAIRGDVVKLEK